MCLSASDSELQSVFGAVPKKQRKKNGLLREQPSFGLCPLLDGLSLGLGGAV